MGKTARRIVIVLMGLMILFIWGNSMLPSDISSAESGWVQSLLEPILSVLQSGKIQASLTRIAEGITEPRLQALFYRGITWLDVHVLSQSASYLVRKAAHFTEYMILGVLMGLLLSKPNGRARFWWPEVMCLAVASIDETIQLFSEGRGAAFRDVMIDLSGATLGVIFAAIVLFILRKR
ncbi:MAG: VanZ family protein [Oscillospiraceae bacterium]|nr:VanZ family protein [Oscillospiraceae bacterium]